MLYSCPRSVLFSTPDVGHCTASRAFLPLDGLGSARFLSFDLIKLTAADTGLNLKLSSPK